MLRKRSDGRLLKSIDSFSKIIPYIIESKAGALNQISIKVDAEKMLDFVRENKEISVFQVLLAAIVRTISQRPAINRFVAGRRIYARNSIEVSFAVKRHLTDSGSETVAKVKFSPSDTVFDVAKKVDGSILEAKSDFVKDDDALASAFMKMPRFAMRAVFSFLKMLEYYNCLPKALIRLDPFHASIFVSNLGSLGIGSVSHHLYEWGTASLFIAMGKIENIPVADKGGRIEDKKVLPLTISCDDRICDGLYYSRSLRLLEKLIEQPAALKQPPKAVVEDVI